MATIFRHAMCNEAFEKRSLADQCRVMKSCGYAGIEIAPFTLAGDPLDVTPAQRREYANTILSEGLSFVGLHWLLVGPKQIHVTTPDRDLRVRSWEYVGNLVDLCADLGENGVMVFGSPKQRSSTGGLTATEATRHYVEGLATLAPHAEARGVTILVEALPKSQSDVVNTLAEAAEVVREINSPNIKTMFDSHNSEDETEPHDDLIEKFFPIIKHIHVNEMNGHHPGTGDYDFQRVFRALDRLGYQGWISLEAFNFDYGADNIARDSINYLKKQEEGVFAR